MIARVVTECCSCGGTDLRTVLSLGSSPPTCVMPRVGRRGPEVHYPLELLECGDCTLVQLSVIVPGEVVFPPEYPYSSGHSKALHADFEDLAGQVNVGPDSLVVDIGANDGTLLSKFDCRRVGVEPTRQAERIDGDAYQEFFTEALAERIVRVHGPADVVTACNVLAHVDDIGSVMRGVHALLADDGVFVAENHDLASVVDGGQWDTVYHEHLRFYSPYSFERLLIQHGFTAVAVERVDTHGGSFRMTARKNMPQLSLTLPRKYDFERLRTWAADARSNLRANLGDLPRPAWGIGATARATTVINYCGLDVEDIACVCEVPGSDKIGRYVPGTGIPVVSEDRLFEEHPRHAVLFSWHLAEVIVPKLRGRGYEGEIIIPLPVLETA